MSARVLPHPPPFKHQSNPFPLLRMCRHQGKQLYLGGFAEEAFAARAHDIMAIKCRGHARAPLNFPVEDYRSVVVSGGPRARLRKRSAAACYLGQRRAEQPLHFSPPRSIPSCRSLSHVAHPCPLPPFAPPPLSA